VCRELALGLVDQQPCSLSILREKAQNSSRTPWLIKLDTAVLIQTRKHKVFSLERTSIVSRVLDIIESLSQSHIAVAQRLLRGRVTVIGIDCKSKVRGRIESMCERSK
jgi:hypothetical protein